MTKTIYVMLTILVVMYGFSISHWIDKPVESHVSHADNSEDCMVCHQNSISLDVWKGVPAWHNSKFCDPGLNSENREEHRSEAHIHRKECMNCHSANFQAKCANCHTQNEW